MITDKKFATPKVGWLVESGKEHPYPVDEYVNHLPPPSECGMPGTADAAAAVFAAYKFASSWALPMFFLYRILLFPNQLET